MLLRVDVVHVARAKSLRAGDRCVAVDEPPIVLNSPLKQIVPYTKS